MPLVPLNVVRLDPQWFGETASRTLMHRLCRRCRPGEARRYVGMTRKPGNVLMRCAAEASFSLLTQTRAICRICRIHPTAAVVVGISDTCMDSSISATIVLSRCVAHVLHTQLYFAPCPPLSLPRHSALFHHRRQSVSLCSAPCRASTPRLMNLTLDERTSVSKRVTTPASAKLVQVDSRSRLGNRNRIDWIGPRPTAPSDPHQTRQRPTNVC